MKDLKLNELNLQEIVRNFDIIKSAINDLEAFVHIADPFVKFTEEGGIVTKYINKTGAKSIKGTIVVCDTNNNSVSVAPADSYSNIGVIYDNNIANGQYVWVVTKGRAQVLLKDSTASTAGNWIKVSNVAGRGDATGAVPSPPTSAEHSKEVAHCVESKSAGTNVLCFAEIHQN
jgi:hypothetical protein